MKIKILTVLMTSVVSLASANSDFSSPYFERPVSCPLRFSNLSQLRDQVQALTAAMGNGCSQNDQQALKQLNSSVGNLEGIATSFSAYQGTDQKAQNAVLAKNAGQILGSLNIITSNNSCFYNIRSRGALPVISDIVMSLSQLGLLIPSTSGATVAAGGYLAGSGMKIINELVKKKFNWNRPEDRRAFIQLNCAFFDNRRVMEEIGLFNPQTNSFKDQLLFDLKKEKLQLIKIQKFHEQELKKLELTLGAELSSIPTSKEQGLNPILKQKLDELSIQLATKPADYSSKWRQVSQLALLLPDLRTMLSNLKIDGPQQNSVEILLNNIEVMKEDLKKDGKAWTCTIDEFEFKYRGPLMAFIPQISEVVGKQLSVSETIATAEDKEFAKRLSHIRSDLKVSRYSNWAASQRLISVEAKINSLEGSENDTIFSQDDEGNSDAVDLLENYRTLQKSILGKEGKGYLDNTVSSLEDLSISVMRQEEWFDETKEPRERCAAAEKLRFAWAQYRYKTQESYDFVATNLDLYRSSFKIGKERQRRSTRYVIYQISSVNQENPTDIETVGYHIKNVKNLVNTIEQKLQKSGCF
jgi:hypothetical protein